MMCKFWFRRILVSLCKFWFRRLLDSCEAHCLLTSFVTLTSMARMRSPTRTHPTLHRALEHDRPRIRFSCVSRWQCPIAFCVFLFSLILAVFLSTIYLALDISVGAAVQFCGSTHASNSQMSRPVSAQFRRLQLTCFLCL